MLPQHNCQRRAICLAPKSIARTLGPIYRPSICLSSFSLLALAIGRLLFLDYTALDYTWILAHLVDFWIIHSIILSWITMDIRPRRTKAQPKEQPQPKEPKFPCSSCGRNCVTSTVECSKCEKWIHRQVILYSEYMYIKRSVLKVK